MIINEFSIIMVASMRLRVGWGEKEKGPFMMIALELSSWQLSTILTSRNTIIIMAESNILGITIHTVLHGVFYYETSNSIKKYFHSQMKVTMYTVCIVLPRMLLSVIIIMVL